jgi:hypothetical protein
MRADRHEPLARHVLAGGRGSRLMELTDRRAKPAVYFGGKSRIIDFVLSNRASHRLMRHRDPLCRADRISRSCGTQPLHFMQAFGSWAATRPAPCRSCQIRFEWPSGFDLGHEFVLDAEHGVRVQILVALDKHVSDQRLESGSVDEKMHMGRAHRMAVGRREQLADGTSICVPTSIRITSRTSFPSVFTLRSTHGAGDPASELSSSRTAGRRLSSHSTGSPSMRSSSRVRWAPANTKTPSSRLLPSSAARRWEWRV